MHARWWNTNEITNKIADWSQEKKKEKKKFRVPWDLSFAQKINQKKDIWSLKPLAESWCSILLRHAHVGSHLVHQALLAKQVLWVRQSSLWLLLHLHCSWAAIIFIPHISTVISQRQCWWYWLKNHEKWKWSVENWRLRSWKMHHPRDLLSFRFKSSESNLTNTILITSGYLWVVFVPLGFMRANHDVLFLLLLYEEKKNLEHLTFPRCPSGDFSNRVKPSTLWRTWVEWLSSFGDMGLNFATASGRFDKRV